jgi:hypothetical protein
MAVIGDVDGQNGLSACGGARQAQRQVVGFAARVDEKEDAERRGQRGSQPAGIVVDGVVQVAGVGVEHRHLALAGGDHGRVTVPDMGDVVDSVEVSPPLCVVEVLPEPPHHLDRLTVGDAEVAPDARAALGQRLR